MEYLYALIYSKDDYSLEEASKAFVEMYVLCDVSDIILNYFDSKSFIKENKHLILEENESKIIILSNYDFEDFDFIKGE